MSPASKPLDAKRPAPARRPKKTPATPPQAEPSLPGRLKAARQSKGQTLKSLATLAKVADNTIAILEAKRSFRKQVAEARGTKPRKRRWLARSIKNLADALGEDPAPWIEEWMDLTDVKPGHPDYHVMLELGKSSPAGDKVPTRRNSRLPAHRDTYDRFCEADFRLKVGMIDDRASSSRHRTNFYKAFAQVIFHKLGIAQPVKDDLEGLDELYEGLNAPDEAAGLHAAIGVSKTVARRRRGIDFVPIPGLRFGLACLARVDREGAPLRWDDVVKRLQKDNDGVRVREDEDFLHVVGIRGEIGATYLLEECGYGEGAESTEPPDSAEPNKYNGNSYTVELLEFNIRRIADRLVVLFMEDDESGAKSRTVFVCGEEYAHEVQIWMTGEGPGSKFKLKNLADATEVPAHDEAIAIGDRDARWKALIEEAIQECFENSSHQLAEAYSDYFASAITRDAESFKEFLTADGELPHYLRFHGGLRTQQFADRFKLRLGEKIKSKLLQKRRSSKSVQRPEWERWEKSEEWAELREDSQALLAKIAPDVDDPHRQGTRSPSRA